MKKQEIIEMIETHLAELNQTATQKCREMHTQLAAKVEEATQFVNQLAEAQAQLNHQLEASKAQLTELETPLDIAALAEELVNDDADLAEVKNLLAEHVNGKINQRKAESVASEQALSDTLLEQQTTFGGTSPWAEYKARFNARFGDKIQWAKDKLAEQLEQCAVRLKAS